MTQTTITYPTKVPEPTVVATTSIIDTRTLKNQGVIFVNQSAMQNIYKNSGPLAKANEYQVHYWFLNLRFRAEDNSLLDIAIPTVYFNYEQFVSGARIDFEMSDVSAMSTKVIPIHNMKVNELQASGFKENLESEFGVTFEEMSVDVGSIHKHPGGSSHQAFSGTDLDTKATEHGVVYPLASAQDDKPNFAGIMAIDSGICNVAHYEYRVANGTLGTDLKYVQGRCEAIIIQDTKTISAVETLLNVSQAAYKIREKNSALSEKQTEDFATIYSRTGFKPFTDTIRPENVKKTATAQHHFPPSWKGTSKTPIPTIVNNPSKLTEKAYEQLTLAEKVNYLLTLDKVYYGDHITLTDYTTLTETEIKESIDDTWELIEEELALTAPETTNLTRDVMIEALVSYGVARATLITAPDYQIASWYTNSL